MDYIQSFPEFLRTSCVSSLSLARYAKHKRHTFSSGKTAEKHKHEIFCWFGLHCANKSRWQNENYVQSITSEPKTHDQNSSNSKKHIDLHSEVIITTQSTRPRPSRCQNRDQAGRIKAETGRYQQSFSHTHARFIRARVFRGAGLRERQKERQREKRDRIKNVLNLLKQFIKKATRDRQDVNIRQLLRHITHTLNLQPSIKCWTLILSAWKNCFWGGK